MKLFSLGKCFVRSIGKTFIISDNNLKYLQDLAMITDILAATFKYS